MPYYMSSGNDYRILNVTLTDAYQDITIPRNFNSFSIQIRNDTKVRIRRDSTLTVNEFTLKEGMTYGIDGSMGVQTGTSIVIFQAKCVDVGATDTLEILYWYV